jgi:hypothetical protein
MRDVTVGVASHFLFLNFVAGESKDYYQQARESYAARTKVFSNSPSGTDSVWFIDD